MLSAITSVPARGSVSPAGQRREGDLSPNELLSSGGSSLPGKGRLPGEGWPGPLGGPAASGKPPKGRLPGAKDSMEARAKYTRGGLSRG